MSNFEKAKYYYKKGFWSTEMLQSLVGKGFITQEEYNEIIG